jgi:hypothetical protein
METPVNRLPQFTLNTSLHTRSLPSGSHRRSRPKNLSATQRVGVLLQHVIRYRRIDASSTHRMSHISFLRSIYARDIDIDTSELRSRRRSIGAIFSKLRLRVQARDGGHHFREKACPTARIREAEIERETRQIVDTYLPIFANIFTLTPKQASLFHGAHTRRMSKVTFLSFVPETLPNSVISDTSRFYRPRTWILAHTSTSSSTGGRSVLDALIQKLRSHGLRPGLGFRSSFKSQDHCFNFCRLACEFRRATHNSPSRYGVLRASPELDNCRAKPVNLPFSTLPQPSWCCLCFLHCSSETFPVVVHPMAVQGLVASLAHLQSRIPEEGANGRIIISQRRF